MKSQKIQTFRKFMLILSMLFFPITIYYFSPYLIIVAALEHIINGSFIVFTLMFVLGIFFGRLWCGFFCPTGGLGECFEFISAKEPKQGWRNYIKYGIWFVWLNGVIICHVLGKGDYTIQPFFATEHGISVSNIYCHIIYYGIVFLFMIPALIFGKRANCHYICWMAPFMILGYKIGKALHLPQLKIKTQKENCTGCNLCKKNCPMSLDIKTQIQLGEVKSSECIKCGACISTCKNHVLKYVFTNK